MKGGLRALRKRVRDIKNIKKITKAMQMISSAKLKKSEEILKAARGYEKELKISIYEDESVEFEEVIGGEDIEKSKKKLLIVITADRGLCGAYNTNILKLATTKVNNFDEIIVFGKKGTKLLKKLKKDVISFEGFWRKFSFDFVKEIGTKILEDLDKYSEISVIYTKYKSPAQQIPVEEKIYPFTIRKRWGIKRIYEPSFSEFSKFCFRYWFLSKLFLCFVESEASEHAARARAMDMATQNADELMRKITLQMNKLRQEMITKELIDITSGKNAIEQTAK